MKYCAQLLRNRFSNTAKYIIISSKVVFCFSQKVVREYETWGIINPQVHVAIQHS